MPRAHRDQTPFRTPSRPPDWKAASLRGGDTPRRARYGSRCCAPARPCRLGTATKVDLARPAELTENRVNQIVVDLERADQV